MTAGTGTTADSSTRKGRRMQSRAASRATASRQASGTDDVPTLPSWRVTSHPDASRSDSATTPPNHTNTTHGNAGSRAARIRSATGAAGVTGDVAVTTSLIWGDVPLSRTAVARGRASINARVSVANAERMRAARPGTRARGAA